MLEGLFAYLAYPPAVWNDALAPHRSAATLASAMWLRQLQPRDEGLIGELIVTRRLSRADAEVIALAKQEDLLAIIDDNRARRAAVEHGIARIGLAGLLVVARDAAVIDEVRPALDALSKTGFHLSEHVRREILRRAGE